MTVSNDKIRVLDLFCGAGGFTEGFHQAGGYETLAGVDFNEAALKTFEQNQGVPAVKCDLSAVTPEEFFDEYVEFDASDVDIVIGGPPCQGYSLAGDRDPDDDRNSLFDAYIAFVDYIEPVAFIAENVPGILSMEDEDVIAEIVERLSKCSTGYEVEYDVLNAAYYGVPQLRNRVIIQGARGRTLGFPLPTHVAVEPVDVDDSEV